MTHPNQQRHPKGSPSGGRFAAKARPTDLPTELVERADFDARCWTILDDVRVLSTNPSEIYQQADEPYRAARMRMRTALNWLNPSDKETEKGDGSCGVPPHLRNADPEILALKTAVTAAHIYRKAAVCRITDAYPSFSLLEQQKKPGSASDDAHHLARELFNRLDAASREYNHERTEEHFLMFADATRQFRQGVAQGQWDDALAAVIVMRRFWKAYEAANSHGAPHYRDGLKLHDLLVRYLGEAAHDTRTFAARAHLAQALERVEADAPWWD